MIIVMVMMNPTLRLRDLNRSHQVKKSRILHVQNVLLMLRVKDIEKDLLPLTIATRNYIRDGMKEDHGIHPTPAKIDTRANILKNTTADIPAYLVLQDQKHRMKQDPGIEVIQDMVIDTKQNMTMLMNATPGQGHQMKEHHIHGDHPWQGHQINMTRKLHRIVYLSHEILF